VPKDLSVLDTVPIVSLVSYGAIIVAAIASMPIWPWSRDWGNGNAGALAYILLVVSINAGITQLI
jgi:Protein of unknown function (DUF3309)